MSNTEAVGVLGRRQSGASAIEFGLLFPVLFSVIYGGIVFGYLFFLQQRVNFAAQEAVRAAVAQNPDVDVATYQTNVRQAAENAVGVNFGLPFGSGLPERIPALAIDYSVPDNVRIDVTYSLATPNPLFPTVILPIIGEVPPLPDALRARAFGRLS